MWIPHNEDNSGRQCRHTCVCRVMYLNNLCKDTATVLCFTIFSCIEKWGRNRNFNKHSVLTEEIKLLKQVGVGRFWANKALEGQAIVHQQSLAPPMLCLLRAFPRSLSNFHYVTTMMYAMHIQIIIIYVCHYRFQKMFVSTDGVCCLGQWNECGFLDYTVRVKNETQI